MLDHKSTVIFILLLPIMGSLLTPIKKTNRNLFFLLFSSIPILNLLLLYSVGRTDVPIELSHFFVFSMDSYSFLFALLVNVCWAITILYSRGYVRYHFQGKAEIFHQYLAASVSLILSTGMSGNIFTLLFFYTLSIPCIYPLIAIRDTIQVRKVARLYLKSTMLPVIFILIPTFVFLGHFFEPFQILSIRSKGLTDFQASFVLALIVVGFSKNCVAPFHFWLPKTSVAPAPVSALVHSVAAVQTGTIAVLKIGVYLYGLDYLEHLNESIFNTGWLTYLCGFTALYSAYRAYKTTDLKERFSFSTVGQISYIITAILVGTKGSVLGAILHIVSHSMAKISLFFIAGIFSSLYGTVRTYNVAKMVPHLRWLVLATAIAGLSITGFPLLAGYYSKDLMLLEEIHHFHYAAAAFLIMGSAINFLYIFPVLKAGVVGAKDPQFKPRPIPWEMKWAVIICSILTLSFSKYIFWVTHFLGL